MSTCKISIITLLIFSFVNAYSQSDTLYFKDGTIQLAHVKKIDFKKITYKVQSDSENIVKVKARKLALIKYNNGKHYVVNRKFKIRINFNVNALINRPYKATPPTYINRGLGSGGMQTGTEYDKRYNVLTNSNQVSLGLNSGVNVLLGRRKNSSYIFKFNYILSKHSYNVNYSVIEKINYYTIYQKSTSHNVIGYCNFFSLTLGGHLKLFRKFSFEYGYEIVVPFYFFGKSSGYNYLLDKNNAINDLKYFDNKPYKVNDFSGNSGVHLSLGYDLKITKYKIGLFCSGFANTNFYESDNINYLAFGIRFYPLKKLDKVVENQ